jgi:hypothetical protein
MQHPTPIVFLPKGGLGNQLIQCAYLSFLADQFDEQPEILVSRYFYHHWLNITLRWQSRDLCLAALQFLGHPWRQTNIFRLLAYWPRIRLLPDLHDLESGSETFLHPPRSTALILFGYCHHPVVFNKSNKFWNNLATSLSLETNDRHDSVIACHFRFGDYLTKRNRAIYAAQSVSEVLQRCLDRYAASYPNTKISVFTDDPARFMDTCPYNLLKYVAIQKPRSAFEDFMRLASHHIIFASNSTFSLAAGRVSSLLFGQPSTILPSAWFVDPIYNASELAKWSRLDYLLDD